MEHKFFRNGVEEKVQPEKWQWIAVYSDGTILKQFDDSGIFHQFVEIDQSRLSVFKMVSNESPSYHFEEGNASVKEKTITLLFESGMKLIQYYDRYTFNANTPQQSNLTVYCFGYQKGREKKIFMILPNGELVITSDPEKVRVG
jgi:hypothetical protein